MNLLVNNAPVVFDIDGVRVPLDGIYELGFDDETGASVWVKYDELYGSRIIGYNGTAWALLIGEVVAQSSPCDISVQPWQASWPSPLFVGQAGNPRFYRHAVGNENGETRFKRLRNSGYV